MKKAITAFLSLLVLTACTATEADLQGLKERIEALEKENTELKQTETGSVEEEDKEPEPKAEDKKVEVRQPEPEPAPAPQPKPKPVPKPEPQPAVKKCEESDWDCTIWTPCTNGKEIRVCKLIGSCTEGFQPEVIEKTCEDGTTKKTGELKAPPCTTEDWRCTEYSSCYNGKQTRTCDLISQCVGGANVKPNTISLCKAPPSPKPVYRSPRQQMSDNIEKWKTFRADMMKQVEFYLKQDEPAYGLRQIDKIDVEFVAYFNEYIKIYNGDKEGDPERLEKSINNLIKEFNALPKFYY